MWLLSRFVVATDKASAAIAMEDPNTANHAARVDWAFRALMDPAKSQSYASTVLRYAVAASAVTGSDLTDDQVQAIVTRRSPVTRGVGSVAHSYVNSKTNRVG